MTSRAVSRSYATAWRKASTSSTRRWPTAGAGAEAALGRAIRGHRDHVVICTKVTPFHPSAHDGDDLRPARFTRDFLFRQAESSLRRLGTDYLDLYLLHQPDAGTPAEEIVGAMDALVQGGKIRYWGTSNHSAAQVREFVALSTRPGRAPIAGLEEYFTIAGESLTDTGRHRVQQLERELFPVVRAAGLGLLAYSPLDAGTWRRGAPSSRAAPWQDWCRCSTR